MALLLAWAVGTVVMAELASPLRKYPGPFLARWTNLWRFGVVLTGNYPDRILALHRRLGPVVRIGPNTLDLDYPELIQTLYSTDTRWRKTDFYHNMSTVTNGRVTHQLFSVTDPAQHAAWKKPMVKYYSIGSILRLESLADRLLGDFCHQLDTRFATADANGPRVCDLGRWIAFCVWDTNGTTLFSKRFGYLDTGRDHDGSIRDADKALDYFAAVGQMPWLDGWLAKNPVCRIGGPPSLAKLAAIAATHLDARMQGTDAHWDPAVPDFLSYFLEAHEKDAVAVDHGVLMGYMLINVLAGADTTAITVRALFYYLLRSPSAWARLEAEVLGAGFDGDGPVAYRDARALPCKCFCPPRLARRRLHARNKNRSG